MKQLARHRCGRWEMSQKQREMPSQTFHVKIMALKQVVTSDCIHHNKTSVMVFQLIMTTHDMLKKRDSGNQLDVIILDFSKALENK